jgi:hypothetical protein
VAEKVGVEREGLAVSLRKARDRDGHRGVVERVGGQSKRIERNANIVCVSPCVCVREKEEEGREEIAELHLHLAFLYLPCMRPFNIYIYIYI